VLSYELSQARPLLTDWKPIVGASPHSLALQFLVSSGLESGAEYVFRYRAINEVGPGPNSDTVTIRAAGRPSAPAKPVLAATTSTGTTIDLVLDHSGFANGGSEILSFKLLRDDGDSSGSTNTIDTEVAACGGMVTSCSVTGLTAGAIYRF
jgi:hypothetical protein